MNDLMKAIGIFAPCANMFNQEGIDQTVAESEAKWGHPDNPPRPKGIMPCGGCLDKPNLRQHRCCFKPIPGVIYPETDAVKIQAELGQLVQEVQESLRNGHMAS